MIKLKQMLELVLKVYYFGLAYFIQCIFLFLKGKVYQTMKEKDHQGIKEWWVIFSYKYCKLVRFPSWVGIVPDNWLEERYL